MFQTTVPTIPTQVGGGAFHHSMTETENTGDVNTGEPETSLEGQRLRTHPQGH